MRLNETQRKRYRRAKELIKSGIEVKTACKKAHLSPYTFYTILRNLDAELERKIYGQG